MTLAEAGNNWIKQVRAEELEESTIRGYEQILRLHISPFLGHIKLANLTKPMVEAFRDKILTVRSRDMAIRALLHLKIILKDAKRLGRVGRNVADDVEIKIKRRERKKVFIPERHDLVAFLNAAMRSSSVLLLAFATILVFTGLRMSEIRGLTWDEFDFERGLLNVRHRADFRCVMGAPKTETSIRSIPLTTSCINALRAWKAVVASGPTGLVFPSGVNAPRGYANVIRTLYDPLMILAKLMAWKDNKWVHKFTPHSFRHAAASLWIAQGFSAKQIQTWMGHSSIQITFDLYGHLFALRDSDPNLMDRVEDALFGR